MNGFQKGVKFLAIFLSIFIIINIIWGIMFALSIISKIGINKNGLSFNVNYEETTFNEKYYDVDRLDIDVSAAVLTIKEGSEFEVNAKVDLNHFSSNLNNGTLKIKEKSNWFLNRKIVPEITVYIPYSNKLKNLNINSGAGTVDIMNISAERFDFNQGAGRLIIDSSSFKEINIDGGVGEIVIENSYLNDLDLESGVGKTTISSFISGLSEIESGVGEVNLNLLGNLSDYRIETEKGIGAIKINGENQPNNTILGTGENRLDVKSGIGSININVKKDT